MKFYRDLDSINESLQRFDSRSEFEEFIVSYASEVRSRIKEGDLEFLKSSIEDLGSMIRDLENDLVVKDWKANDITSIKYIITAAQTRIYK